ncbi:GNAT family N-acetyltransferase [Halobacteriovorax sp. HLS]|uniref:GNAT family N-acetyltransferase n=1 Tax=Halobacteriovorax sp. HLS TaxID=2234000 RepID=UPI000FD9249E|nr:GNAT family N-acetyltransferase [Halobacteriovorax sp. HLS]
MNIHFVEVDISNKAHLEALLVKENDESIRHLIIPKNEKINEPIRTEEQLVHYYQSSSEYQFFYLIKVDEKIVGDISLMINPSHLLKKDQESGWIGIAIWDRDFWGKDIASRAMDFLEELTKDVGLRRMELGVFEFNIRAKKFYEKCGFKQFSRIPKFTKWDDKFWDDIRMEKVLED